MMASPSIAEPNQAPITVAGLKKTYRVGFWLSKKVQALRGIDFVVQPGQIYGLLGPNGAGKSTAIKVLLNLVQATEGNVRLFGRPPSDPEVRRLVGFVPENPSPYEYLTGGEFLALSARLAGIPSQEVAKKVQAALGVVEMTEAATLQIRRYSKGMVQRVALAQALIAEPKLLVLDEPTSGLDPLGRRQIRDIILAQRAKGTAVLFCSHIIPDVEALCDRVAVLVGGKVVREGTVQALLSSQVALFELVVEGVGEDRVRALCPQVESLHALEGRLLVKVPEAHGQALLNALVQAGAKISRFGPARSGLEDEFMRALKEAGRHVGAEMLG
jgi:ABC-2 type transport system ATP-binding protein